MVDRKPIDWGQLAEDRPTPTEPPRDVVIRVTAILVHGEATDPCWACGASGRFDYDQPCWFCLVDDLGSPTGRVPQGDRPPWERQG